MKVLVVGIKGCWFHGTKSFNVKIFKK